METRLRELLPEVRWLSEVCWIPADEEKFQRPLGIREHVKNLRSDHGISDIQLAEKISGNPLHAYFPNRLRRREEGPN